MPDHQEILNAHFPSLFERPDPPLEKALQRASLVRLAAGDSVFYPGSPCRGYAFVIAGGIRCQVLSALGRQIVLYQVGPGDSCVLTTSCLLGDTLYPAEGIAQTETCALLLPREAFREAFDQSPALRCHVFRSFASSLATAMARLSEVVFGDIDGRLVQILLSKGTLRVAKTHQELADELGTAREVVSRHLKRLEHRGWLTLGRGSIELLDTAGLRAFFEIS
jgi:CRP/FNR family transcriptional regulator